MHHDYAKNPFQKSNWGRIEIVLKYQWGIKGEINLPITEATHAQFPMTRHTAETGWAPHVPQATPARRKRGAGLPPCARPSVDEQRKITAISTAIDYKIDFHQRKRAVLYNLPNALLHNLMTGKFRWEN